MKSSLPGLSIGYRHLVRINPHFARNHHHHELSVHRLAEVLRRLHLHPDLREFSVREEVCPLVICHRVLPVGLIPPVKKPAVPADQNTRRVGGVEDIIVREPAERQKLVTEGEICIVIIRGIRRKAPERLPVQLRPLHQCRVLVVCRIRQHGAERTLQRCPQQRRRGKQKHKQSDI